jgi:hypothetical protein
MMVRLLVILLLAAVPLKGDAEQDITAVVSTLTGALSAGAPDIFLKAIDHEWRDYRELERAVTSLVADTAISCTVDLIGNTGSADAQQADLDWYMVLRSQQDQNLIERRRTKVTIKLEKRGKKWVVTSFTPMSVFAPMNVK